MGLIEIECLGKLAPPHHPIIALGACSHFEISMALQDVSLRSDGPLSLLLLWVYDTKSKIALSKNVGK